MNLAELRQLARQLEAKLPYQEMADSPGVKHYVDWAKYEGYAAEPPAMSGKAAPCEVLIINGRYADAGACRGVEVRTADEVPLKLIQLDNRMNAAVASRVLEAVHIRLSGAPEAPIAVRISARGDRAFSAAYVVLDFADGFAGDVAVIAESEGDVLNSALIEGVVGGGSSLNMALVSISGGGPHYVLSRMLVEDGASVAARPLAALGPMNSLIEEYIVEGARASVDVVGLEVGRGKSRVHHYVSAVNDGEYGRGRVRLVAIAKDESWVVQRALGRITKRGRWSESVAEGVTYIASRSAVAITQPILYIDTGDVEGARHSAADASLDEEKAFYLRARGFSEGDLGALMELSLMDQYASSLSEGLLRLLSPYVESLRT
ncbi:MAG: SufD family Fe-S cluster assembly protein [Thermoproteus sp.]|uniref:SufD family Fe-S cluster assembly protein n=1 Tax=Thermoproteus sp. CP80 TaxID=1650659 RepID=UPI0009C0F7DA|nr:SufD family Fe-S cluster assembly protein [Thermoproteus sp. CP80]PLC64148.1 SufBD protein [Thermoproteus sp. CP80]